MKNRLLATVLYLCCLAAFAGEPPLTPIAALDLPRYMGTWYEIAKFPIFRV